MWVWAIRDVVRKPVEAVWLCAALGLFVAVIGTPLLFTHALSQSVKRLLAHAPSIVVRKVDAGGWHGVWLLACWRLVCCSLWVAHRCWGGPR